MVPEAGLGVLRPYQFFSGIHHHRGSDLLGRLTRLLRVLLNSFES
jgi:hypothetical protein